MTFKELTHLSEPHQYAIYLDKLVSKKTRKYLRHFFFFGSITLFIFAFFTSPFKGTVADSAFFVFLSFFLFLSLIEFFYNSSKNQYIKSSVIENFTNKEVGVEYAVSILLSFINDIDASKAMFESPLGLSILHELSLSESDIENFLKSNRVGVIASSLVFSSSFVDLEDFVLAIYDNDHYFKEFLSSKSINRDNLASVLKSTGKDVEESIRKDRFWSKENLFAIPSVGSFWGLE